LIDSSYSNIARIYEESGRLVIITNEASSCAYLTDAIEGREDACEFSTEEGEGNVINVESGSSGLRHSFEFDRLETYYLKCKDVHGNERAGSCDMIVTGGMI